MHGPNPTVNQRFSSRLEETRHLEATDMLNVLHSVLNGPRHVSCASRTSPLSPVKQKWHSAANGILDGTTNHDFILEAEWGGKRRRIIYSPSRQDIPSRKTKSLILKSWLNPCQSPPRNIVPTSWMLEQEHPNPANPPYTPHSLEEQPLSSQYALFCPLSPLCRIQPSVTPP